MLRNDRMFISRTAKTYVGFMSSYCINTTLQPVNRIPFDQMAELGSIGARKDESATQPLTWRQELPADHWLDKYEIPWSQQVVAAAEQYKLHRKIAALLGT